MKFWNSASVTIVLAPSLFEWRKMEGMGEGKGWPHSRGLQRQMGLSLAICRLLTPPGAEEQAASLGSHCGAVGSCSEALNITRKVSGTLRYFFFIIIDHKIFDK